ncbi:MAG TPA: hypothetical protein VNJ54_05750 [Plantibacter sp.]|uniref:hypothetical protein n=1 Tax=unclassified Plantibacter TaxID=2624265 RepID=UPI002B6C927E|nr:hypothetical protein [Plantibacter sp.]
MNKVLWLLGGFVVSVLCVLLVGVLSIQIIGLSGGAVFGLDNSLVGVTAPSPGLLQLLAIAAVSAAVLCLLTLAITKQQLASQVAFRLGFVVGASIQIVASVVLLMQRFEIVDLNEGPAPWVEGWLARGGSESAVHVVFLIAMYVLITSGILLRRGYVNRSNKEMGQPRSNVTSPAR